MIDRRSGASCSEIARATSSTMVAGRNAPASSWESSVRRWRMSVTDGGSVMTLQRTLLVQEMRRNGGRRLDEGLRRLDEPHYDREGPLQRDLALHDPGHRAQLLPDDLLPVPVLRGQDERRGLCVIRRHDLRLAAGPAV